MKAYVTGEWLGETEDGHSSWAINGLFDTEENAIEDCIKRESRYCFYFKKPLELNESLPEDVTEEEAVYPKLETSTEEE